jgi:hypothetical protein
MISKDGRVEVNPPAFCDWLKIPATDISTKVARGQSQPIYVAVESAIDQRLGEVSNQDLHPENRQWVSAAFLQGSF